MSRIRITFLIRDLITGGAERQLVTLAQRLDKRRFDVSVVCFYPGGTLRQDLRSAGIPVFDLGKKGRWDIIRFFARLMRVLCRIRPHILHGYLSTSNIITVSLKPFFRRMRVVWGVRASNMDLTQYDQFSRLNFQLECFLSTFADLVIVNSHTGRDYHVVHGFPERKTVIIPNGIDTDHFSPGDADRQKIRSQWNVAANEKLIGLVARLDPVKDHATFLKAASLLAREKDKVKFVLVGEGPEQYKRHLVTIADKLRLGGRLIWAGNRTDMPAVYSALDILSLSSSSEGFSNVICEAMACGVPCVVTDAGDSAMIVGDTGIVVPVGDSGALAQGWEKMLRRIGSDHDGLAKSVRLRVQKEFDIGRLVTKTSAGLVRIL